MTLIPQFSLAGFVTSAATLSIGILVLLRGRHSNVNKVFFIYSLAISQWSFFTAAHSVVDSEPLSLFSAKIMHIGVVLIPILFLHFCLSILEIFKRYKILLPGGYLISGIFILIDLTTPLIVSRVRPKLGYHFFMDGGFLYPLLIAYFAIYAMVGLFLLLEGYLRSEGNKKNQLKYLFWGSVLGYTFGPSCFLPVYDLEVFPYPFGGYAITAYVGITALAIVKYHLMDIEVIIKKTTIFAGLFVFVYGTFSVITVMGQRLFEDIFGWNLWVSMVPTMAIIIFAFKPLEDFLIDLTDRYLFQKKYDYKQILKSFIDEVITVLSLDKIATSTIELLNKTLHPEKCAILLLNRHQGKYISYASSGYTQEPVLEEGHSLIRTLKVMKDIAKTREVGALDDNGKTNSILGAEIAIPLMLHDDLIGIMLLDKKKSGDDYSKEDLDILTDLARTEAVAIGNAQLFADAAQNERRAAIGTLAAGINHEIRNPLNIINTKAHVYMLSLKEGLYRDKKPDEVIAESVRIMESFLKQTERIADITAKLSDFARPSKDFKPVPVDVAQQIDETLSVIGHELELEHIRFEKDYGNGLPKISADERQIQQILFNIIRNAGQAIKENGLIRVKAYVGQNNGDQCVNIEIADNGIGIPKDKLNLIYEPFFTTKEPDKSTGLGLAIVRQLVWRNRGDIKVSSFEGKGTTFTLIFPAMESAK